jgi:hypothetical protein
MHEIELEPGDFRLKEADRGAPLDFGKPSPKEATRETNPILWGGILGTIAAIIAVLPHVLPGMPPSENPLLQSTGSAFGGGFFWGWMAGNIKISVGKWMAERANRPH